MMQPIALLPAHLVSLVVILVLVVVEALLPAVMPPTLPFGVRVPRAKAHHPAVRRATRSFFRRLGGIAVLAILTDLAVLLVPGTGALLAGPAVVVLTAAAFYINYYAAHRTIRRVKEAEDWFSGATQVIVADTRPRRTPSLAWAIPSLAILAVVIAIGIWRYPVLPDRFPTHFGLDGTPDQWSTKSILSAFGILIPQVLLFLISLLVHISLRAARTDVDPEDPDTSWTLQSLQRRRWIRATWGSCALAQIGLGLAALLLWGMLGPATGWTVFALPFGILIGVIVPWLAVLIRPGKAPEAGYGTHRVSASAPGMAPAVHRDDDDHWIGGALYYNPDDPAWMVPKRFGIGWTLNFARPGAWLVLIGILALAAIPGLLAWWSR
ncbi:DUF5808 domain-containing protein [Alicyclobacillus sp.]|uniref:DUF1648 domain-containing protein n=1 Tax=Alicyclobacillus sp. TaxID=61169 RepID=UPI0025C5927B|nr:DUF5808 domain-containing protein [Alicyclobacillus sp.]MCL6517945.1 DUF5808 domain-containing protein [Alicyclobacillus sp.]